jgi:hypothetical protein
MAFDGEGVAVIGLQPLRLLFRVAIACGLRSVWSLSKKTRSPTLTTKSCWLPGVAALAIASEPTFLLAQAPIVSATASTAASFKPWRIRIWFLIREPPLTFSVLHPVYRALVKRTFRQP